MNKKKLYFSITIIIIIVLWILLGKWNPFKVEDAFSPINALFAGFALIGVVYAVILQQKELRLQNQELRSTREVFLKQQFEQRYFNMLKVQENIRRTILEFRQIEKYSDIGIEGHLFDFFATAIEILKENHRYLLSIKKEDLSVFNHNNYLIETWKIKFKKYENIEEGTALAKASYIELLEIHHNELGSYCRHLFHILDFLKREEEREKSDIENNLSVSREEIEKKYKYYAALFQAQLSSNELVLVFYNSLCFPKLKKLIHHYQFLENLAIEDLIEENHKEYFVGQYAIGEKPLKLKSRTQIYYS